GRARHARHRPCHPGVRRGRALRRLAARRDVRERSHAALRRRPRRGAPPADRPARAARLRAPPHVKVRIGFGGGARSAQRVDGFAGLVDGLEANGFDSLWCSERATGPIPDPVVALTFAAGRTKRLKLGTSVQVLPGRNPLLLAKQWASLDVLSGGRALPAFGL